MITKTYKVLFVDLNEIEFEYTCKSISPVNALVKAEEELKLSNWLNMCEHRDIQIKVV